ncbi:DNA-binding CsgD family transcriptional regulator [Catenulispora sp. MAP5-51]|uniref:helix-turn-helix transcriptional regulator n=1 Tax=Catenulispora sp. MAP5-51 TaxID=3156298 RepID=UPI0035180B30
MGKTVGTQAASRDPVGGAAHAQGFAFVGREHELATLLSALHQAPAVVLVGGEAGIGKSRLVAEAKKVLVAAGGRVLTGYCHPLREPSPYGPIIDALREAAEWLRSVVDIPRSAGVLAPLLPDLADRLPEPPTRVADTRALVDGLHSLLSLLGPATLVVEDMHWADDATREMLLLLTRDMPAALSLVLTFRNEDLPLGRPLLGAAYRRQPGTTGITIEVEPLTERSVHQLARQALGPGATPELSGVLYQRCEGVPLVVEEDLITLAENRHHRARAGGSDMIADLQHAELPHSLREAFTERLTALSPAATAIAEAAAVIGVEANEDLLAQVADLDPEQGSLGITEALRAAVLQESGIARYSFRHMLAQQASYQQIPGPRRVTLHRRAIEVMEAQDPPPLVQIAHHTLQTGDTSAWLERAEAAADQATAVGDVGTAATLLNRVLETAGLDRDVRSRAALALAAIVVNGVDYATSAATLRRILADPQLPTPARGEIRLSLGMLMTNHAGDRRGSEEIERSLDELAERPDRAVRAMAALVMNERAGGPKQAWIWMNRAEAALSRTHEPGVRAAVQATRLSLLAREADPDVWALVDQMPRHSDDQEVVRQTARALCNVGEVAIELGHDRRAAQILAEGIELGRRTGFPHIECYCRNSLLRLAAQSGKWADIDERYTALANEYPDTVLVRSDRALTLGQVAAARGQRSRALQLFKDAAVLGETEPQVTVAVRAAAGLARMRLADDEPQDAWAIAAAALETLRSAAAWVRSTGLIPVAVKAALGCGQRCVAEDLVLEGESAIAGAVTPAAVAELHIARGTLMGVNDPVSAAQSFERARLQFADIGRPYDVALAGEQLGVALAAAGDGQAAVHLQEALSGFDALGATHDFARCQRTMYELGLAGPVRRGRRGYGDRLSPREQQVAELLAQGATNQDIAQALFLSPRTVETHVARVLKKLGATRGNVADALRNAGPKK